MATHDGQCHGTTAHHARQLTPAPNGERLSLGIGLHGIQMHLPTAIIAYIGTVFAAGKFNGDKFAWIIPTPNRAFLTLLQHHMTAEDIGQVGFCLNKNCGKEDDNTTERKKTFGHGRDFTAIAAGGQCPKACLLYTSDAADE